MTWEVDWSHEQNNGERAWARNPRSKHPRAREWHWVATGYLRNVGVSTPKYRKDSWEIDWKKRNGKLVWARNAHSKMPSAHEWHWVDFHTLNRVGIAWRPANERKGRGISGYGYVILYRTGMTNEDIALAEKHGLFLGAKKAVVLEHRLVALKKYGALPKGTVIRHINGIKTDNRPENLVKGTTQENTMDHNTARLMAMYWREKYEDLKRILC
jgi:hypothetical protein